MAVKASIATGNWTAAGTWGVVDATSYLNAENATESLPNMRNAFQDCLTNVPSTAAGTNQAAGWVAVQAAMQRLANRAEKLYATGTGTTASPATMVVEGTITADDVQAARNLP